MPTPTPSQIVTDPEPLNPAGFPFRVLAFPAAWLLEVGDFNLPKARNTPLAGDAPNFEPGQE